ncbi:DUF3311 domain-containing protein [Pirellulaceae bacterium]|jgi:hypothetical protein|nr:DUF3311 domain-containing protein [Mariniblastus sp.]MDB4756117.1 DUF3311 domain-containing protein [Mariniblastus sp.]MDB4794491.1 DUF3311 domain-containing protein [Pirellulaceae bacterium]
MKNVVWGLVILLIILHQDFWFWTDKRIVLDFIPIGLFYHALISIAAGVTWYLATIYAWPEGLDDLTAEQQQPATGEDDK